VKRIALALAITMALATAAHADRDYLTYKVKAGDSLALLAAEYYGDRNHAVFIMVANKLDHPRPLKPGEKLRIPVTRVVTVAVGDTLEALAQSYLGDKRRARYLAEFNDLAAGDSLVAGASLSIPFHVTHTAAGDETLAAASRPRTSATARTARCCAGTTSSRATCWRPGSRSSSRSTT
jgi:nucleoid-associated protein YgaU